jgi:glycine/D-amino acid oxidase-like deaminating enzyme
MTPRFAPFWYDRFPQKRRVAFPRYKDETAVRVAIVGGGLAGCACACALAAARVPVILLEADRIGAGSTAGADGLIREDFDTPFSAAVATHGLRASRVLWQGIRRAALEFPAALRRLRIQASLEPQDLVRLAAPARDAARVLRREYEARRAAGLDHSWFSPGSISRSLAVESGGGVRTHGSALDPYRTCLGLAGAAVARGAQIFERSEVRRLRANRTGVDVHTPGGVVHASMAIVSTNAAIPDLRPLKRHLRPRHRYGVVTAPLPPAVRRQLGTRASAIRDDADPPHVVRWLRDDRVLIEGADQEPVPARARDQALVQRTGQLMYELSLLYPPISGAPAEWAWSRGVDDTLDGLPYIGPHRNFPRHLFALGLARHGAGSAWLAARLLVRHVLQEPAKGDELFGFARILQGH